jgi:general secretion pathway protein K
LSRRRNRPGSRQRRQRGIALLVVLWVLALLAALLVGFAGDTRTELLVARNQYENAQARALADAGVSLAVVGVLDPSPDSQFPADGTPHAFQYGDGTIKVRVQDEGGKVDLNAAPPELIGNLMRTLGITDGAALTQQILTWRREHQMPIPQDGRNLVPPPATLPGGAFQAVEQLRLVPGLTRAIYDRLFPYVTVYSALPDVDPLTAPEAVLRSLPGVNADDVPAFMAQRQQVLTSPDSAPQLPGVGFLAHRPVQAATVLSEGRTARGAVFSREAVLVVTREPATPYHVVAWRQLQRDEQTVADADAADAATAGAPALRNR